MNYWGGVRGYYRMCVCGVINFCIIGKRCNCDVYLLLFGGVGWREDSGFLIDKFVLFVL